MKTRFTFSQKLTDYIVAAVLAVVPFHAFLTVWAASFVGHYTLLRLWDDVLLAIVTIVVATWMARSADMRQWFTQSLLVRLIAAYVFLSLVLGMVAYVKGAVTLTALAYGLLINLRFLVWFLVVMLVAQRHKLLARQWSRLVIVPAAIAVGFAVLQYVVLPHNFLEHFGYNATTTIAPIETINNNPDYIRVQSTLRGPNPLGAYLVVVLAIIAATIRKGRYALTQGVLGLLALVALYATGSRSAWIGAAATLVLVAFWRLKHKKQRLLLAAATAALLVVGGLAYIALQHNPTVQNAILHTQNGSKVADTSNEAHLAATKRALGDVVVQPWGAGPGTAGPASQYNGNQPARIAENYYIQIAQEVGWLGLALLLAIFTLVGVELYSLRGQSVLAVALLASFIGLACIGMLLHVWVDDTLAFVWWGLAGIALGSAGPPLKKATI